MALKEYYPTQELASILGVSRQAVSVLIAEHVQLCFTRERELHEAADACTDVSMLAAINIEADWPGQGA